MSYSRIAVASIAAALFALALTPVARALLTRFGVVDQPSARRINKRPVPRGGGMALVASFGLAIAFAKYALGICDGFWAPPFAAYAVSATAVIVATGVIDDIRGLKPVTKLVAQIAAACMVFAGDVSFGHIILCEVPDWLDLLITIGWFVIIVNAFNLIDGLDGLASGLAVIGAIGLGTTLIIRGNTDAVLTLFVLTGACLGFLRYNYNPASIFLGDTGSLFIGFILALAPLVAGGKTVFVASVGVPLLAVGLPLFDTFLAILRRSARVALGTSNGLREIVMPDVQHLHHRLLSAGMNQHRAARVLYAMATVLVLAAICVTLNFDSAGAVILGILIVLFIIGRQLTNVELWYVGNAINKAASSLPRRSLAVVYVVLDIVILLAGWVLAAELTLVPYVGISGLHLGSVFPIFFICIFASFVFFRIYVRLWDVSQGLDAFMLEFATCVGWLVAYSLVDTFGVKYVGFSRHSVAFLAIVCIPLLGARMLRIVARASIALLRHGHGDKTRVIIYGSGIGFYALFSLFKSRFGKAAGPVSVSAVVDDDPNVIGGYIQGFRVEDAADIAAVASRTGATSIVLAKNLTRGKVDELAAFARERGMPLRRFSMSLRDVYSPPSHEI